MFISVAGVVESAFYTYTHLLFLGVQRVDSAVSSFCS